jgi:hypothetical protein
MNTTLTPEPDFAGLVIDPQHPETSYALTTAGLLKTTDSGDSWVRIDSQLTGNPPQALVIDPQNPETLYVSEVTYTCGRPSTSGIWKIDGLRAHGIETDHTGSFLPVSATISVIRTPTDAN